ncbi:17581_t:CDS:2 [Acaulospora morrowiae]|uniref:17581_t:CDS:1 n=1 Tax=Acaulospora morrowiae TaxID=94023 RepID=A0A9N8VI13_9GLOM|nr:17581_t:CDS:2 [Acaulospora morrowiae]
MSSLFRGILLHAKNVERCGQQISGVTNLLTRKLHSTRVTKINWSARFHTSQRLYNASAAQEIPSIEQYPSATINTSNQRETIKSSNPPLDFPCIDQLAVRSRSLDGGPEPAYENIVSGYSVFHHDKPFLCDFGGAFPELDIAYESWGELNEKKDNAILIHTGLSGSSHAKSHKDNVHPGWWEQFIGPGLSIDTSKFFVICTNVVGGCYGSTGPSSIDPSDGERYATRFPIVTIFDMVRAQFLLLDHLGIEKLYASVGSSMGGMQSLASAWMYPDRVSKIISISACARSHPYSIALRHTQRQVLMSDPNWKKGFYYNSIIPHVGMKLAREIATISYRSGPEWESRFGRERISENTPALCPDFLIETYLDHQGERFCLQYDPNSLLYVSKAMDLFDMSASSLEATKKRREVNTEKFEKHGLRGILNDQSCNVIEPKTTQQEKPKRRHISSLSLTNSDSRKDLVEGLSTIQVPALVLGVQSDILFPCWQQREITDCLREGGNNNVTYYELDSMYGHDTFLIDLTNVGSAIKGHLEFGG